MWPFSWVAQAMSSTKLGYVCYEGCKGENSYQGATIVPTTISISVGHFQWNRSSGFSGQKNVVE